MHLKKVEDFRLIEWEKILTKKKKTLPVVVGENVYDVNACCAMKISVVAKQKNSVTYPEIRRSPYGDAASP